MPTTPPPGPRRLIVNADDLGQSDGVNRGIAEAFERGVVTSSSLMVRWPAAERASHWARSQHRLSVGLHVDLGESTFAEGEWRQLYTVVDTTDRRAVADEVLRQIDRFLALMGRPPSHVDSHQHHHRHEPLRSLFVDVARELDVPLRQVASPAAYCGSFYGQQSGGAPYPEGITYDALLRAIDNLDEGVTELACHPGADDLTDLDSPYKSERAVERVVLCDARVPGALAARSVELCTYEDVATPS